MSDNQKLSQYQPPAQIAQLAAATRMTEKGRRLFYLTNPQIEVKKSGLNLCNKAHNNEKTVVLGCYISSKGIYIQQVSDPRLQGVMEITAAHEMLHAAYQEMSATEQASLNQKLRVAFQNLRNPRLLKLLKIYEQQDPSVLNNELHSILGTEVADLGSELEKHYQEYFADRSVVVAFSQRYEQTFTTLAQQADQIDQQLAAMKPQLEQLKQEARAQGQTIDQQRAELERLVAANQQDLHNAKLPSFNQQVNSYNQLVSKIKQKTENYNQLVNTYNSLSLEEKSLNNALSSSSADVSSP
jgi:hypothetical protein